MSGDRIDWALWRSFLAVCERGSLSEAARYLSLSQPTIGRHIDLLETSLGQALFVRAQKGMIPTETAQALIPEARAMSLVADSLARRGAVSDKSHAGTVRIAASHVVGEEILPLLLPDLMEQASGVRIELALSNENADLLHHEADIAVRMVRPIQGSLIMRKIADVALGLFAHRSYLERKGTPSSVKDLSEHLLIGADRDRLGLSALGAFDGTITRETLRLRTDSEAAQLSAIRAGLGIGVMQCGIAKRMPQLVPVLADDVSFELECWLTMPKNLRHQPHVRFVSDYLADHLSKYFKLSP